MSWKINFKKILLSKKQLSDSRELFPAKAYKLKFEHRPKYIYKYYPAEDNVKEGEIDFDSRLTTLKNKKIYLSATEKFNDPFDSSYSINIFKISAHKFIKRSLTDLIEKKLISQRQIASAIRSEQPEKSFEKMLKEIPNTNSNEIEPKLVEIRGILGNDSYDELQVFKSTYTVCSFSERFDSILMWSHYSNNHKGFCVEYDLSKISMQNTQFKHMCPVNYSKKFYDLTSKISDIDEVNSRITNQARIGAALTKSIEWAYEKEWRIVAQEEGEIDSFPIKTILLGAKMSDDHKGKLYNFSQKQGLKRPKEMHMLKNKFLLNRSGLTIDELIAEDKSKNNI